ERAALRVPAGLGPGVARVDHPGGHPDAAQVRQRQCRRAGALGDVAAAMPDRDVAAVWCPQAERDPGVVPARQAERPERHRPRDRLPQRLLVYADRVGDQLSLRSAHPVQVTGQVHPAQQGIDHGERDLTVSELRLRVGPHGRLLWRDRGGGGRRDRRVAEVFLLVARGLELQAGQQRIVGAHAAGGAVLDYQPGIAVEYGVQPVELGPVRGEQPRAGAQAASIRARPDGDVVVELEVPDAQLADQEVDYLVQVFHRRGMAQVQVVAAVLDDELAVALEEGIRGKLPGDLALHADHLGFEPQAR